MQKNDAFVCVHQKAEKHACVHGQSTNYIVSEFFSLEHFHTRYHRIDWYVIRD